MRPTSGCFYPWLASFIAPYHKSTGVPGLRKTQKGGSGSDRQWDYRRDIEWPGLGMEMGRPPMVGRDLYYTGEAEY